MQLPGHPPGDPFGASGPVEYKDAPLRFTFDLDGRREPVKIVDPHVDLPFPEGGRLLIDDAGERICEVTFRFDADAQRPYRLVYTAMDGDHPERERESAFGRGVASEGAMRTRYRETLVKRGNVHARVEMQHAKARLVIDYRGPTA